MKDALAHPEGPGGALQPIPIDVVSVQSQVVYGHVGNSAALPTLRAHGLNVAAVPSVLLSNTPHYPTLHGGALPVDWFEGYLHDLEARGALDGLLAILVGYLGNPAQAEVLSRWIARMLDAKGRHGHPHTEDHRGVQVILDPVIGDQDSGVYAAAGLVDAFRDNLLPLAHGLTPNGFELQSLTGLPVATMEEVVAAARSLLQHKLQLRWVVVTSAAPASWGPHEMRLAIVTRDDALTVTHPRIPSAVKGTGDVFSAELTALLLQGVALPQAARLAGDHVVAALRQTARARCAELLLPIPKAQSTGPFRTAEES